MKPKNIKIRQHASNLGYIKGLPQGSGHGGFFIDPNSTPSVSQQLRALFSKGAVVHIKDKKNNDYILNDFMAGDTVQGSFICPVKLNNARKNNFDVDLQDIISSIDTIPLNDVEISNSFSSDEDAINYFIMNTYQGKLESATKFDKALNEIYAQLIR